MFFKLSLLICILAMFKNQHLPEFCFARQIYPCQYDIFSEHAKSHAAHVERNNRVTINNTFFR